MKYWLLRLPFSTGTLTDEWCIRAATPWGEKAQPGSPPGKQTAVQTPVVPMREQKQPGGAIWPREDKLKGGGWDVPQVHPNL